MTHTLTQWWRGFLIYLILSQTGKQTSSTSGTTETDSEDDTSTIRGSATEEYVKILSDKEKYHEDEKEKDDEEDSLGEELMEVPVFYAWGFPCCEVVGFVAVVVVLWTFWSLPISMHAEI